MKLTYCGNDENSLSFICVDFSKSPPQVYKRAQVEFRQDQFTALRACAGIEQLKASEEGQERGEGASGRAAGDGDQLAR